MARSQESQNKKDKESKKLKKRQEKEEKKAERKASGKKSFEDMIAYVDEFGNITDTPPDPNKKKAELNLEDIQLGAKKEVAIDPADLVRKGNISFFNEEKGYGFIRDERSQESIFFHVNNVSGQVKEKDKVSFETEKGPKGLNALKVTLIA